MSETVTCKNFECKFLHTCNILLCKTSDDILECYPFDDGKPVFLNCRYCTRSSECPYLSEHGDNQKPIII